MDIRVITVHENSWNGPPVNIFIPQYWTFENITNLPFNQNSWETWCSNYPDIMNRSLTVFCPTTSQYNNLSAGGFTHLVNISALSLPKKLYVSKNYYIEITSNSSSYYYITYYGPNTFARLNTLSKSDGGNMSQCAVAVANNDMICISYCAYYTVSGGGRTLRKSAVTDASTVAFIREFWGSYKTDPYSDGGTSTSGGGSGSFDEMTDTMSEPSYDAVESYQRGYANHGFAKVYIPTSSQLDALHTYLWSSNVFDVLKKMYASPIDCIISLNMIPLDLSSLMGDPPAQGNIIIGGTDTGITNVNMPYTQFIELDCGSISISEFFGSYLDYSPYTKLQIFLPYIGMQDLDVDDFMNGEIGVKYYIDIVSGDCVAYINQLNLSSNAVRGAVAGGAGVLYQFTGNVAFNVPISAENFAQIYAASAGAMISGSGMLAMALSGGMSAPMALTGIASTSVNVATSKPSISRGGSIPSTAGYLGIQVPYLILTRPRQCLPEDQNALIGYPAYVTVTIEDIEGYNEFEIVHLENIPATDAEKAEIEKLLKSGVIL